MPSCRQISLLMRAVNFLRDFVTGGLSEQVASANTYKYGIVFIYLRLRACHKNQTSSRPER